jgi:hypothetical protein
LIVAEVLQGFDTDEEFDEADRVLHSLTVIDICGKDIALLAVKNFRALRSRGVTVRKTIDTLIATRCIADDLFLLHADRDFEPFVKHLGLRCVV